MKKTADNSRGWAFAGVVCLLCLAATITLFVLEETGVLFRHPGGTSGPGSRVTASLNAHLLSVEGKWRGKPLDIVTQPLQLDDNTTLPWSFEKVTSNEDSWGHTYTVLKPASAKLVNPSISVTLPTDERIFGKTLRARVKLQVVYPEARDLVSTRSDGFFIDTFRFLAGEIKRVSA
jgi:hypothetical protein